MLCPGVGSLGHKPDPERWGPPGHCWLGRGSAAPSPSFSSLPWGMEPPQPCEARGGVPCVPPPLYCNYQSWGPGTPGHYGPPGGGRVPPLCIFCTQPQGLGGLGYAHIIPPPLSPWGGPPFFCFFPFWGGPPKHHYPCPKSSLDGKNTRLNPSHSDRPRMPSSV